MKTIWRIARVELSTLFYSPIAWLVLVIFSFQTGSAFSEAIQRAVRAIAMGQPIPEGLTDRLDEVFRGIDGSIYLYLPLLTMGLMSRETSSGSIKLLQSSPVSLAEIILGKYTAVLVYGLLMCGIIFSFCLGAEGLIVSADMGRLLTALLGTYALIAVYGAIGLLMSSLTTYQVIAAICTLAVLAFLSFADELWQSVGLVRHITYFLSVNSKSLQLNNGLISSKSLVYFVILIAAFLGLAVFILEVRRRSRPTWKNAGLFAIWLAVCVGVGYVTSIPRFVYYYDATASGRQTLLPDAQLLLRRIREPLKIHTYVNIADDSYELGTPENGNSDHDFFEKYQRFLSQRIRIDYAYYYDSAQNWRFDELRRQGRSSADAAREIAEANGIDASGVLTPDQAKARLKLDGEEKHYVRLLESGDRTSFLRIYDDMWRVPTDDEIIASLRALVANPPKLGFLTGQGERSVEMKDEADLTRQVSQKDHRDALINQGFDIAEVNLDSGAIPADISVVVIADPKFPFKKEALDKLDKYIQAGGSLMILGEPGREDLLNPLLANVGVRFLPGSVQQVNKDFPLDFVTACLTDSAEGINARMRQLWQDSARVSFPSTLSVQSTPGGPFEVQVLAASPRSWNSLDTGRQKAERVIPLVVGLQRRVSDKLQRIMVAGDADFMTDKEIDRDHRHQANLYFLCGVIQWLSQGDFPQDGDIAYQNRNKDNQLRISRKGVPALKLFSTILFPGIFLVSGILVLIRRKVK